MSPTLDISEFIYVDTAVGGVDRRNNVIERSTFAPNGTPDVYSTFCLFTDDLLAYARAHPNKNGGPSVAKYPGAALAAFVPFDLDDEGAPANALSDARRLIDHLGVTFEIPRKAIRIYFSGMKGFSLEVPSALFGGFEPAPDVAVRIGRLVLSLTDSIGLTTLDTSIYEVLRLWRWPNTLHGRGKRYKVPLTPEELFTLDIDAIRDLAVAPRDVEHLADDEWSAAPELVTLWEQTATGNSTIVERKPPQTDGMFTSGHRHHHLRSVAGAMRRQGCSEDVILAALRAENALRCDPPKADADVAALAADISGRYAPEPDGEFIVDTGEKSAEPTPTRRLDARPVDAWLNEQDEDVDVVIGDGGDGFLLSIDGKGAIAGPTGIGKSNLLLRLGRCLCEGTAFLQLPIPQPRSVLHLALEGSRKGTRKRLRKVWDGASAEARARYHVEIVQLNIFDDLDAIGDLLRRIRPEVVIFDPLRNLHTGDENDSQETAKLTAVLDGIIARHHCALIVGHHNRKASPFMKQDIGIDAVRGSTGFTGWLSFCLNIRPKPKNPDVLYADFVKVRDAEEALPALELEFLRSTIDFKASTRGEDVDVEDAIKTAVFHNGSLKKAEIIEMVTMQTGAGKRAIADTITVLAKSGGLAVTTLPGDKAKTYSLPVEQMPLEDA